MTRRRLKRILAARLRSALFEADEMRSKSGDWFLDRLALQVQAELLVETIRLVNQLPIEKAR